MKNKYGLDRAIPEPIQRQVRQACGFGCIFCGVPLVEYEHIVDFAECSAHEVENIALLCPNHHAKVTRGFMAKADVVERRRHPITFALGACGGDDIFRLRSPLILRLGTSNFEGVTSIVRKSGKEHWLRIEPPEEVGGPIRLSARFYGSDGRVALDIAQNHWRCLIDSIWDITLRAGKLVLRESKGHGLLEMSARPPSLLSLDRLAMMVNGSGVSVMPGGKVILAIAGSHIELDRVAMSAGIVIDVP